MSQNHENGSTSSPPSAAAGGGFSTSLLTPTTVEPAGIARDDRAGADGGGVADGDVAEHGGAGAEDARAAHRRVALGAEGVFAGGAERDAVEAVEVGAEDRGRADDDAGGVVEHHAVAHRRRRVDVDEELEARLCSISAAPICAVPPPHHSVCATR